MEARKCKSPRSGARGHGRCTGWCVRYRFTVSIAIRLKRMTQLVDWMFQLARLWISSRASAAVDVESAMVGVGAHHQ